MFDSITKEVVSGSSVILAILAFTITLLINRLKSWKNSLQKLLIISLAASSIPTGIILILCAFDLTLINRLEGLNVHIAAAGLALLYIVFTNIFSKDKNLDENDSESNQQ